MSVLAQTEQSSLYHTMCSGGTYQIGPTCCTLKLFITFYCSGEYCGLDQPLVPPGGFSVRLSPFLCALVLGMC